MKKILMILFLIFLSVIYFSDIMINPQNIKFQIFDISSGLSQNTVNGIFQDKTGYIWMTTQDGLNRFDGEEFFVFRNNSEDKNSLSANTCSFITEDYSGNLWIGTNKGLNKFNSEKKEFTVFSSENTDNPLSNNFVRTITNDYSDKNIIWIGTNKGISRINTETDDVNNYLMSSLLHDSDISARIILSSADDFLWVFSYGEGLYKFNKKTYTSEIFRINYSKDITKYDYFSSAVFDGDNIIVGTEKAGLYIFKRDINDFSEYYPEVFGDILNDSIITSLLNDNKGNLWIGTNDKGIFIFNESEKSLKNLVNEPADDNSLSSNWIRFMYSDKNSGIWIGTYTGGVNFYDENRFKFTHYYSIPYKENTLSNNTVRGFDLDDDNNLWIATEKGVNRLDRKSGIFYYYRYSPDNINTINSDSVRGLYRDKNNILWAFTWNGISYYNEDSDAFIRYDFSPFPGVPVRDVDLRFIYTDSENIIWLGSDKGLIMKDNSSYKYFSKLSPEYSVVSDNNRFIFEDSKGKIWVSGLNGVFVYDKKTDTAENFSSGYSQLSPFSDYFIFTYLEYKGYLWVGTQGGGLFRINTETYDVKQYGVKDGMPNQVVYGILNDKNGNLWFSTNNGLSRFNPDTETFTNFGVSDGVQSTEFNNSAYYISKDGEMFFGGMNGFNSFIPEKIPKNNTVPDIVFKSVLFSDSNEKTIILSSFDDILELDYDFNSLKVSFNALEYSNRKNIKFMYGLSGYSESELIADKPETVSYRNLSPGLYTFRTKSTNSDGDWTDNTKSFSFRIKKPFYMTVWARIIYISVFIISITAIVFSVISLNKIKLKRIERENELLEVKVLERTCELNDSLEEIQSQKSELEDLNQKLEYLSMHDPLTGLSNRLAFTKDLEIMNSEEYMPLTLIVADIDYLKYFNDILGHVYGDILIKDFSGIIDSILKDSGASLYRIGGDEFCVLFPKARRNEIELLAEKVFKATEDYNRSENSLFISFSYGLETIYKKADSTSFFSAADKNMYRYKLVNKSKNSDSIIKRINSLSKKKNFFD